MAGLTLIRLVRQLNQGLRREPELYGAQAEREQAGRELDEILYA